MLLSGAWATNLSTLDQVFPNCPAVFKVFLTENTHGTGVELIINPLAN